MYTFDEISTKINWKIINFITDKLTKYEDAGLNVIISANTKCHQNGKLTIIWDNNNQFHTVSTKPRYTYRGIFYSINVEDSRLSKDFSTTKIVSGLKSKFNILLNIEVYSKFYCLFSIDNSFLSSFRRDFLNESTLYKFDGYTFEEDFYEHHHGQSEAKMNMYAADYITFDADEEENPNMLLAYAEYAIYKGKVHIGMIESIVKGKGYGIILMKHLAKLYGYENLERGSLTPSGDKMRKKLDNFFNFDYEKHVESKCKHIKKERLNEIKNKTVSDFLIYMVENGYSQAWDKFMLNSNFKKLLSVYDMNDVSEIASWVRNSKSNLNYMEENPPKYVINLLDKLCQSEKI